MSQVDYLNMQLSNEKHQNEGFNAETRKLKEIIDQLRGVNAEL